MQFPLTSASFLSTRRQAFRALPTGHEPAFT